MSSVFRYRPSWRRPRRFIFSAAAAAGVIGVDGVVVGVANVTGTLTMAWQVGDRWLVGVGATGAWAGEDNNIAEIASLGPTVWSFTTQKAGYTLYIKDENEHYKSNGSTWELI